ncbi:YdiU family protein [Solirubrobacter sp. CPCC 204708]|uniref:Protein nucleotidyltransferase YdiU n=1 Tax=Solirubrobacter deserti TaxID=2282478 RepID=A0ABT4RT30_9ACTN|nr:YdiU family protein [Solirubrobacter deserti]MBE2319878.1 YdiU family protein [Solirubrobacter deserti]MDA0141411.1 YdiU family protein [Solirubrobacter deserti]
MAVATLDNTFARELEGLSVPWQAAQVPQPRLLIHNEALAAELGVEWGVDVFAGNEVPEGATPVAQVYAGHQFGGYSPRLGDGRALLLGEVVDRAGRRRDLHLKGSGRTPFARGGDGKAVVGPMLREAVIGEAMHALGIPTTRALAVVATGEKVMREAGPLPGAVLTRVASSHLRVGTFEYAARNGGLRELADYAIARHYPGLGYLEFFEAVVEAQASLVARWMLVGFIHGVMNTDNMAISGETIDYGPCAFMDRYDPATVFSSIDHMGRYAYGNQPAVAQWNLARLGETLLPLIGGEDAVERATSVLTTFEDRYGRAWRSGMAAKLGLREPDTAFIEETLKVLEEQRVDFTSFFRALPDAALGDNRRAHALFAAPAEFDAWADSWRPLTSSDGLAALNSVNPIYIPRNHLVEEALAAAMDDDLLPLGRLMEVLARPFEEREGREVYAEPGPERFYQTFCGT